MSFKNFLLEYLVAHQRNKYKNVKMSEKARADTDHFFGVGNDKLEGPFHGDADEHHFTSKSNTHHEVEHHLGTSISSDEYRAGVVSDKYGRQVSIGKAIKDTSIRDRYASDPSRNGTNSSNQRKTYSIHRGVEVAGQTNYSPNDIHPKGHSWTSCKNPDVGMYANVLEHEIRHGSVVHFIHDENGKEIYRGTLQPHHDEHGNVLYKVNSTYGNTKASHIKQSHDIADKLNANAKSGVYKIHPDVYDDNRKHDGLAVHIAKPEDAEHLSNHSEAAVRRSVAASPITPPHVLEKLSRDEEARYHAFRNPNLPAHVVHTAHKSPHIEDRVASTLSPHTTAHVAKDMLMNDDSAWVRRNAASHHSIMDTDLKAALDTPNSHEIAHYIAGNVRASAATIHKALDVAKGKENERYVGIEAAKNPNSDIRALHRAAELEPYIIGDIAKHRSADTNLIHKALKSRVGQQDNHIADILNNKRFNGDVVSKVISDHAGMTDDTIKKVTQHKSVTPEHIVQMYNNPELRHHTLDHPHLPDDIHANLLQSKNKYDVFRTLKNPKTSAEHLHSLHDHIDSGVRFEVSRHPSTSTKTLSKLLRKSEDSSIREVAIMHPNTSVKDLQKNVTDKNPTIARHAQMRLDDINGR